MIKIILLLLFNFLLINGDDEILKLIKDSNFSTTTDLNIIKLNKTILEISTENSSPLSFSTLDNTSIENFIENTTEIILQNSKTEQNLPPPNTNQNNDIPESCDNRKKLKEQPIQNELSKLKKCCPYGESLNDDESKYCDTTPNNYNFNVNIININLYEKCIEDTEEHISLEYEIGNPCNVSYIYGMEHGDILYVIQNGSLLILDEYRNESYQIENDYCLDINYQTGQLYAIVCVNSVIPLINKGQIILFTIFMICSIPCLLIVSYLHFIINELRTLHGLSVGFLSINLAIGFFLHSIASLANNIDQMKIGYAVQYFILGYFFWLFILCVNVFITVWIFIPRYIVLPKTIRYTRFGIYFIIATLIPLILVLITKYKGFNGMPSYFYQAWSESIRSSQRYFIPPVTVVLIVCIILLGITFKGFKNIDKMIETQRIDFEMYRETKKDFKCIVILTSIIFTTWIFEILTFYLPSLGDHLIMMELFNGLQGVFILAIFIGVRNRRHVIVRWWYDRGSLNTDVEMTNLNSNKNHTIS